MLLQIDTNTTSLLYTQTTQLDGVEYSFRFIWSDRESAWYFDINDQDGNPIAPWIRVVVEWSLLRRFQNPALPPGLLYAKDMTGAGVDIQTSDELGARVPLLYMTSDDPVLASAHVDATVKLVAGFTAGAGTMIASTGNGSATGVQFTNVDAVSNTTGNTSTQTITFIALNPGSVTCPAHSLGIYHAVDPNTDLPLPSAYEDRWISVDNDLAATQPLAKNRS